ncbi:MULTISPECIES: hypothetical protein [unclassified Butyrivibrio]|uniref:hypothetical protein n=1 Tax=unclassified Butyrivibrio TaxID=2639466 RepID=UPI0003B416CB|nr:MULTISPECIES: hypothetical protein [unclassified Butyrivibrio]MDC7294411.1 hypothetical protein [Butyrivibrio sp. DSM 10294]
MSKDRQAPAHVGSASILLIFTVLSLISFSALTMVNSKADYNLSYNLSRRQAAYYEACHKGNAFVAAVNSGYTEGASKGKISKSIPITDNQSLNITLMSNFTKNSGNSENTFTITQWKIVNFEDSGYDTTLPVLKRDG